MLLTLICVSTLAQVSPPPLPPTFTGFPAKDVALVTAAQERLNALATPESLKEWHKLLASEPHIAGTDGGNREVARIKEAFSTMDLDTKTADFWPLLSYPDAAALEVVAPDKITLDLSERPLKEDPSSAGQGFGWNAYSGSGDVTANVVYANFGTKADFEKLAAMHVDLKGKIVIARYGGNFRGYKAKFAQAAGAAGLVIFTDPANSGYTKGLTYPEGGFANDCCIQRGSILTLPYTGDPLTPNEPATEHVTRLNVDDIALPKIPVQPISYAAAKEILSRMKGQAVPDGWQGGLPFTYRVEGGDDLRVRLMVKQRREVVKASNIIATIKGTTYPEQMVIVGCHHDAWNCGAADPLAGTIVLMECAKSFAAFAKDHPPLRTIVFAAWDAEEFGIIGSAEWVEANRDALAKNGIAYINLDMASMGLNFGSSASPSLRSVIMQAAAGVPQPGAEHQSVLEAWREKAPEPAKSEQPKLPVFGDLGGGSDHVAFLCHAGVPSCSMGGGGSKGWSYHSAYDTLPWYWKVVGLDYQSALMVTRVTSGTVYRLAYAPIVPFDTAAVGADIHAHLISLTVIAAATKALDPNNAAVAAEFGELDRAALSLQASGTDAAKSLQSALDTGNLTPADRAEVGSLLLQIERAWMDSDGLPARGWYQNLYAAPDEDSGYASWILPGICHAVTVSDRAQVQAEVVRCTSAVTRMNNHLASLEALLTKSPSK